MTSVLDVFKQNWISYTSIQTSDLSATVILYYASCFLQIRLFIECFLQVYCVNRKGRKGKKIVASISS